MVTIEKEIHLFPSRTQKLSLSSLMILGVQTPGKVSRSQFQWPLGQAVKTPPFHGGNRGSNPLGVTKEKENREKLLLNGIIAQLGEHLPYKQGVIGSSPIGPTICGSVVQLVRMPACHAGGRGFESLPSRHLYFRKGILYAGMAQR